MEAARLIPVAWVAAEPCPARVLVVEDDVLVRAALAEELRAAELVVIEASSAEEALALLAAAPLVDLVISDVHMGGRLDGVDLGRRVRQAQPALPVILTSGIMRPDLVDGEFTFISKPYAFHVIVALAQRTLGQQSGRP